MAITKILDIVFWVTVVEWFMGHVPGWCVALVFGVSVAVAFIVTNEEKRRKKELNDELRKMADGFKKNKK